MSSPTTGRLAIRRNSVEILQYAKRLQEKYILHPFWDDTSMGKTGLIANIPDVDIAEAGCFKYLLIEVRNQDAGYGQPKFVVRGDASCAYHADILNKMKSEIDEKQLALECNGGGRIQVDPGTRTISVYGHSQKFGRAQHEITVKILKEKYPQWTIQMTDEDY